MATNRAQTGGLDYLLPQNRYVGQQPGAPPVADEQATFFDLPKNEAGGFDEVEGLTDKFYDLRGQIESFALDMQKKYKIDVTQPDYTAKGGGLPFKTFQKLSAQLMSTANALKNSYTINKEDEEGIRAGTFQRAEGYDPTAQPSSEVPIEQRGFSTRLLPEVVQANDILKTAVYTQSDQDRFKKQVSDPIVTKLKARMADPSTSPAEREYLQRNIDAIVQQPRQTPYAAFQAAYNGGGGAKKPTIEIDILKDTTNLAQGRWGKGTYSRATDSDGDPILVNKKREGEQYGEYVFDDPKTKTQKRIPRIIDRWVKKADGSIHLEFKKGDGGVEVPSEKVSDKRGDAVASNLISSNPKYGSLTKMYEAAREYGITDETGSVVNEALLSPTDQSPDLGPAKAAIDAEKERIRKEVRALPIKVGNSRPFVPLKSVDGDQVMVKKGLTGKYYVELLPKASVDFLKQQKQYVPGMEKQLNGKEIKSGLTEDQLMEYLTKDIAGYFDQFLPAEEGGPSEIDNLLEQFEKSRKK